MEQWRRMLFWGGLALLLAGPARAGQHLPAVLVLPDTLHFYDLGLRWDILTDRRAGAVKQPLTLAQVQVQPYARQFVPSTEPVPDRENTFSDYWLRCRVRNEVHTNTAWLFWASLHDMRGMEVFLVDSAGGPVYRQGLGPQDWASSHVVFSTSPNLNLPLRRGHTYTLYVHSPGNVFHFGLIERTCYLQSSRVDDVKGVAYFSILLALLVYNLLLFFSVRDRSYLYYVSFVLAFGLLQADMMGYLHLFWLHNLREMHQALVQNTLLGLTLVTSLLTGRSFLETRRLRPQLDRAMRLALFLTPLPALSSLLGRPNPLFFVPIGVPLLVCLLLLVAGVRQLAAGYRPARFYMAGWTVLIIAIVYYYLRTVGLVSPDWFTEYGVQAASALEVLLLSLGLADRINLARRDRASAQQAALLALTEKEEVQRTANEALRQRAEELQTAYADLRHSIETTDRLQEIDELKTRFFTGISHELRTPLTLILGPLEQLLPQPAAAPLAGELKLMHRHGQRLLLLINQLLDIARLEAGQMQLQACATDLAAFTGRVVADFSSLAATKKVHLQAELPPDLPAYADHDQLEKILMNLLGNALKFTETGGSITVRLTAEAAAAVLVVTDTGCGIAAQHLPHLFDRFYQADGSTRRRHDGSGIGLALVKELVALHQGTVTVQSEPGQGSSFTVRLPLGHAHLQPEEIVPAPLFNEESGRRNEELSHSQEANSSFLVPDSSFSEADARPVVLIVEDHDDMRTYIATCLGNSYHLLTAPDGPAALAQAAAIPPDLLLTDLMMPGMDGLELCRRFKTDPNTSHIPVVVLTARASDESRLEGLELGADDYLTKPFRPAELRTRVANLLAQRAQLRARFGREITLQPANISITPADEVFLTRVLAVVEAHMGEPEFDVEAFASELAMTRNQLFRKLKALTDQAPSDFVRTLRLRRAAQLLAAQAGPVAEIAYRVGFNNLSYFSKCFRELHGHSPSEHGQVVVL